MTEFVVVKEHPLFLAFVDALQRFGKALAECRAVVDDENRRLAFCVGFFTIRFTNLFDL